MWASNDWLDFCGFSSNELLGQTLSVSRVIARAHPPAARAPLPVPPHDTVCRTERACAGDPGTGDG